MSHANQSHPSAAILRQIAERAEANPWFWQDFEINTANKDWKTPESARPLMKWAISQPHIVREKPHIRSQP